MYAAAAAGSQRIRRIAVLGARGVGKSALTIRFCEGTFPESYLPTIEDTYQATLRGHDDEVYALEIVDTAGQDEYSSLGAQVSIGIDGYVLLYSVRDASSFEMIRYIHQRLAATLGSDQIPKILVGNQIDQAIDREVSFEEGAEVAESIGAAFCECSARTGTNVVEVFRILLDEIERSGSNEEGELVIEEDNGDELQNASEKAAERRRVSAEERKIVQSPLSSAERDDRKQEAAENTVTAKKWVRPASTSVTSSSKERRSGLEAWDETRPHLQSERSGSMLLSRCGLQ
jgi:Ras family protein